MTALWEEYRHVIDDVAQQYGRSAHQYGADSADFWQELALWIIENGDMLEGRRAELSDEQQFEKYLAGCLRNESSDYFVDVRDQAGGQPREGAHWYSVGDLKTLLPYALNKPRWHEPPPGIREEEQRRGLGNPAEGGNWIAILSDLSRAFDELKLEDRALLVNRYLLGHRNRDMAAHYGLAESTMSDRVTRALERLQERLGGRRPNPMRDHSQTDPWRGRHAISSARARAITSSYYDGEDS